MAQKKRGKGLKEFAGKAWNFVKKNKVLSTVANQIPHPLGKIAGWTLGKFGLGKAQSVSRGSGPSRPSQLYGRMYIN